MNAICTFLAVVALGTAAIGAITGPPAINLDPPEHHTTVVGPED